MTTGETMARKTKTAKEARKKWPGTHRFLDYRAVLRFTSGHAHWRTTQGRVDNQLRFLNRGQEQATQWITVSTEFANNKQNENVQRFEFS